MFENAHPPTLPSGLPFGAATAPSIATHEAGIAAEAVPLRLVDWSELTARLNAARDLRQLLRKDVRAKLGDDAGEGEVAFADAAARFFRANEEDQRPVNHKALEPCKPSSGMYQKVTDELDIEVTSAPPVPKGSAQDVMREKSDD